MREDNKIEIAERFVAFYDDFVAFLKANQSYENFKENLENNGLEHGNSLRDFCERNDWRPYEFIGVAFNWGQSPQGRWAWEVMSERWKKHYIKIENKYD